MDEQRYRAAEGRLLEDAGLRAVERFVALRTVGGRARLLDCGAGLPILFLHGGPWAAAGWSYVAARLPGYRCILVDRPGCGLSAAPPAVPDAARLPGYVTALTADVLDALDLRRVALVGSSLGGYSALRSAAELGDRVDGVVLAGCPAFVPGWRPPSFFTLLRLPVLGDVFLGLPVTAMSTRLTLRQLGHGRSLRTGALPGALLEWVSSWQRDTDTMRNDATMIRACGSWRNGFEERLDLDAAFLRRVAPPCHVIAPTDDPVGGAEVCSALAGALPAGTVEVWEGAGHLPWLDDPSRAASAIDRFIKKHAPAPRES